MDHTKVKTFKDAVHGYIYIPEYYIKYLIDDIYFQRLRNIEQTGMRVLYPSAKHDRFSHSLGVFHLGRKAMDALRQGDFFEKEDFDRYEILFLTACLLHDIGHTPFSHSLEESIFENSLVPSSLTGKWTKNDEGKKINEKLIELINDGEKNFCDQKGIAQKAITKISSAAPHEMLGSYLIFDKFRPKIEELETECGIYVDDTVLHDDICFIVRMIMGIKYEECSPKRQERNCFIELLNGDNFDVDKLDYIVRDNYMSGINNVSVDVERLLSSLCVVTKTRYLEKEDLDKSNIDNLTITRLVNSESHTCEICGRFKGILKVYRGAGIEIDRGSFVELFRGSDHEMAEVSYTNNDQAVFVASTKLKQDNEWVEEEGKSAYDEKVKQLNGATNRKPFGLYFEKGELKEPLKIKARGDLEIHIIGFCKIKIKGEFESIGSLKLFHLDSLKGTITEVEMMDNILERNFTQTKAPSEHGYNTYSIGFRKQAINVIANVLEARNYLYLWVYTHHKVIYYANFLIPVIVKELSAYCGAQKEEFPSWRLCYANLKNLDDYYIWTAIRYIKESKNKDLKFKQAYVDLVDQLFSRVYNWSLYKSLAEFELVFDSFTADQKSDALKKLRAKTDYSKPYLGEKRSYHAGYLYASTVKQINNTIKQLAAKKGIPEFSLKKLLYVVTEFKQKRLDPNKVYLDMGDEKLPISQIRLLSSDKIEMQKTKDQYFYLYYSCDERRTHEEVEIIKEAVKKFLGPQTDQEEPLESEAAPTS